MDIFETLKTQAENFLGRRRSMQNAARAKAAQFIDVMSKINIELGAGSVKGKNGWITIDQCEEADITWDLNIPLPFPDQSVTKIYSSHVLEHFFYHDLIRLLTECYRVLKPGGSFSACVPDTSIYV
jgi:predicted SAM-dependent methyltransferase